MSSVWYVGRAKTRSISIAEWASAGITAAADTIWNGANGYSIPTTSLNAQQIAILSTLNEFNAAAPDGPRTTPTVEEDSSPATKGFVSNRIAAQAAADNSTFVGKSTRPALLVLGSPLSGDTWGGGSPLNLLVRTMVKFPVTTTRWRFRFTNIYTDTGALNAGALSFTGVWGGTPARDASGKSTGAYTGDQVAALSAFTTPADGSEYVSAWVTDAAQQFTAHTERLMSWGFTGANATKLGKATIGSYFVSSAGAPAQVGTTAPAGLSAANVSFGQGIIEYEFVGTNPIGLFIGDSLTEAQIDTSLGGGPHFASWPGRLSTQAGILHVTNASAGRTTSEFTDAANAKWTRLQAGVKSYDFAAILLGANDILNSTPLATYQANIGAIMANLRANFGVQRIYLGTVMPRGATGTPETLRLSYNDWLRTLPFGASGCWDFDRAVRNPAAVASLDPIYAGPDNVHLNRAGYGAMAAVAQIVRPPA